MSALDEITSPELWNASAGLKGEACDTAYCPDADLPVRARAELAALRAEVERLRAALRDAVVSWSFNNDQGHTHSWHDREDWFARHEVARAIRKEAKP